MQRSVRQVIPSQMVNMGGIILDQPLPYRGVDAIDPFLLIHHWSNTLEGNQQQKDLGVGPHPHRGFSPVTFIFKGGVHHQDSLGTCSEVFSGGVQWMNSGRGIIHSERPVKELAEFGGDFEIIQLWINTPIKHKLDKPFYAPLHQRNIPQVVSQDKKAEVNIVCGEFAGINGAMESFSPMLVYRLDLKKGAELTIPIPEGFNALIYQLDGLLECSGEKVLPKDLCWFYNNGSEVVIYAKEDTRALFLAGRPLNEPVYSHGPFVMDSEEAVMDAIRDYQIGGMGTLKEVFD